MYYYGVFFLPEEQKKLYDPKICGPLLENIIEKPHVTFAFNPPPEDKLPDSLIGKPVSITITGLGNDGYNHGYSVDIPEEVKILYTNPATPHITLSIAKGANAKNTKNLKFSPIENFKVIGELNFEK